MDLYYEIKFVKRSHTSFFLINNNEVSEYNLEGICQKIKYETYSGTTKIKKIESLY